MTNDELTKFREISETPEEYPVQCGNCRWQGPLKELNVKFCVLEYPRVLACPNCHAYLIHNLENAW